MTISNETRRSGPYFGNGLTVDFDYDFKISDKGHLQVIQTVTATGAASVLTVDVDYTVSGVGDDAGGTITLTTAPPSGETVTILLDVPFTQTTNLPNQGPYFAEVVEDALDLSAQRDLQLKEQLDRTIVLPPEETGITELPALAERSGKVAGYGAGGDLAVSSQVTLADLDLVAAVAGITAPGPGNAHRALVGKHDGAGLVYQGVDFRVDTLADLKALQAPAANMAVHMLGRDTAGDAGFGFFRWDDTSSDTADDGLTILPTGHMGNGRWKRIFSGTVNVRWFGAVGDGVANDQAAIQAAIDAALATGGGAVYLPRGNYLCNSTLTVTGTGKRLYLFGDGPTVTRVSCGITGAAADPLLKIDVDGNHFVIENIEFDGNNQTGTSGNGNAISCINPGTVLAPQLVTLRNVRIQQFRGTGKDEVGNAIPACGFFAYKSTSYVLDSVAIYQCGKGVRMHEMSDSALFGCSIDACDDNAIFLDSCDEIKFLGGNYQGSGGGAATDGNFYSEKCENISFHGAEFKNGHPFNVNQDTTEQNRNLLLSGCKLEQFDAARGVTQIQATQKCTGLTVENCRLEWANTITTGKGVEVVQNSSGQHLLGLRIVGNAFSTGHGGTIAACVHLNLTSNRVHAPLIESNVIGNASDASSATAITDGILLDGLVSAATIQNNVFAAFANFTITDCIHINSSNVLATRLLNNQYLAVAGTITNELNNSAGVQIERKEFSSGRLLSGSATFNPSSLVDGAGETTTVTVSGAALGDFVEGVSFDNDLQGITVTAWVSAANTVSARFQNETGGTLDLASGTLRVRVRQQ